MGIGDMSVVLTSAKTIIIAYLDPFSNAASARFVLAITARMTGCCDGFAACGAQEVERFIYWAVQLSFVSIC